jgi:APA family basic amino acid/polyamine antiporter
MPQTSDSGTGADHFKLRRELNVWHGTSIVVGAIIGSGIFLVPTDMMRATGSALLVCMAWIVGGALSLFGALTYSELGSQRPHTGGSYVFIRDAYGPLPGFLFAWSGFMIIEPACLATIVIGLIRVLGTLDRLQFLTLNIYSLHIIGNFVIQITYGQFVALSIIASLTVLNYLGVRRAGNFQLVFTFLKAVTIIVIAVIVSFAHAGSVSHFAGHWEGARGGVAGFMAAVVATMWAFNGWDGVTSVAGEVRNPKRSIPFAILGGTGLSITLYLFINAAVQYALPVSVVAQSPLPAATALALVIGHGGAALVSVAMAVGMLTTLNGGIMVGPRMAFAAVESSHLSILAKISPRFQTPSIALLVQAAVTFLLILSGGSFRELFSLAISTGWFWSIVGASTIFVFRRREPRAEGAYRMWGYPYIPMLFIVAVGVVLFYAFADSPWHSLVAVAAVLIGVPIYYFSRIRNTSSQARRELPVTARPASVRREEVLDLVADAEAE